MSASAILPICPIQWFLAFSAAPRRRYFAAAPDRPRRAAPKKGGASGAAVSLGEESTQYGWRCHPLRMNHLVRFRDSFKTNATG
jgi:hypothetical protein